jgi:hypothetical protein
VEGTPDALGHQERAVGQGRPLGQDDELVSPQSTHGVTGAQHVRQADRHRAEKLVPRLVAERVVGVLEVVEIDEAQRHRAGLAPGPQQHLLGPVQRQLPVGQPGE